jgi:hypothetical protein
LRAKAEQQGSSDFTPLWSGEGAMHQLATIEIHHGKSSRACADATIDQDRRRCSGRWLSKLHVLPPAPPACRQDVWSTSASAPAGLSAAGRVLPSAQPRDGAPAARQAMGTPRRLQPWPALARPGQAHRRPRPPGADPWLVHRGLRYARSQGGQGAARRGERRDQQMTRGHFCHAIAGSNDDAPNLRSRLKGMKQPALYAPARLGMKIRLS